METIKFLNELTDDMLKYLSDEYFSFEHRYKVDSYVYYSNRKLILNIVDNIHKENYSVSISQNGNNVEISRDRFLSETLIIFSVKFYKNFIKLHNYDVL